MKYIEFSKIIEKSEKDYISKKELENIYRNIYRKFY